MSVAMNKFDVRSLLNEITGGQSRLTLEQLQLNRDRINQAVSGMRRYYKSRTRDDQARRYYQSCWREFDQATTDEELVGAVEFLRSSIYWE